MIKNLIKITALAISVHTFIGCNPSTKNENPKTSAETQKTTYKNRHVIPKTIKI